MGVVSICIRVASEIAVLVVVEEVVASEVEESKVVGAVPAQTMFFLLRWPLGIEEVAVVTGVKQTTSSVSAIFFKNPKKSF